MLTVNQTYYNEPVCIRNNRLVAELNIGVSPARDPALLVAWRSSLAFSQCDTFLVEYRLSCKHGQTWQQRTAAAAKYPFLFFFSFFQHILFSSPLHPHILFAHHDTLPCSILLPHLISSHPATIPVSLSFITLLSHFNLLSDFAALGIDAEHERASRDSC